MINPSNWMMSGGKTQMLRHMAGERLYRSQGITAKCAECCGGYQDGRMDCKMPDCPLHPWMPYRKGVSAPLDGTTGAVEDIAEGDLYGCDPDDVTDGLNSEINSQVSDCEAAKGVHGEFANMGETA